MGPRPEQLFRALCDETRLRCLLLLQAEGELCVCELTHALDVVQPKVSRHLAVLRELDLVADRRQGQWVYYRLHDELPDWVREVISATGRGAEGEALFMADRQALVDMPGRPSGRCCA
jgi:ArsR family transcriptional regulator